MSAAGPYAHWGDPQTWTGDWRRTGRYLTGERRTQVNRLLTVHDRTLVAMAIRGSTNVAIAAIFSVSREAVAERLRPLGLNIQRGVRKLRVINSGR